MATVKTPSVTKIKFDEEGAFSSLHFQEWIPGYNHISVNQLNTEVANESIYLTTFLRECSNGEYDETDVLSVKASSEGIVERIYGPVILASEDGKIILRSGSNIFPIRQEGRNFILGSLKGELEGYDIKIKKETPEERTISIPRIDFISPADKSIIYSIRVLIQEGVDGEALKQLARSEQPIAPYLTIAKSGGVDAYRLHEVPEGEYRVTDIDRNEGGKWGTSYLIVMGNQGVWSNKSLRSKLDNHYEIFKKFLAEGKAITLKIANIRDLDNGNKTCDAALFLREPKAIAPKNLEALKPAEVIETEVSEVKQSEILPKNFPF